MIERLIYIALSQGIEDVLAEPRILERYFKEQHLLSTPEVDAIKNIFIDKTPKIIHSYPRADSQFPLLAIVLDSERESQNFLDDQGGMVDLDDLEDPGADINAAIWERKYAIYCVSDHPDITRYYYELVKFFMIRALDFFKQNGVLSTVFSGGDLAPDPRYIPAHLFVRQFLATMVSAHEQVAKINPGRAFKIDGVYVSDDGQYGVGGVKTLVTIGSSDG